MKLLLDENLSDRIVPQIIDLYPASSHVKHHALSAADDAIIWDFARKNDFIIVSKDADFHQRSLVFGAPPHFIYLRVGNCTTHQIVTLLRNNLHLIDKFGAHRTASVLILP